MNFATTYPEMVSKIALLAPTTYSAEWNTARVEKIADIDIQIWHGTADVNVPYSLSTTFVNRLSSLGREIPLVSIEGIGHWFRYRVYRWLIRIFRQSLNNYISFPSLQ